MVLEHDAIPDDLLPAIDDLPGDLGRMALVIEAVAPGCGVRAVVGIVAEFRGTYIYCRNLDDLPRRKRDRRIIAMYGEGQRVAEIARWARLSERQIWTILGREPGEEKQLKLF